MSDSFSILLAAAVCLAGILAALYAVYFACLNARKRAASQPRANAAGARYDSPRGLLVLDLGGRFPAKRRRPCGRHGEGGGNCADCEHKHEHHDHDHDGGSDHASHGKHCARGHCQK